MKIHTSPPRDRDSLTSRTLGGLTHTSDRQQRVWELQLATALARRRMRVQPRRAILAR
jgi:hypothetical protein